MAALTRQAMTIERYFGTPRDIEWAIDKKGIIHILQARSAERADGGTSPRSRPQAGTPESRQRVSCPYAAPWYRGTARHGSRKGLYRKKACVTSLSFPKGAVLVAKHDSSLFVRVMPYVSAIITETGSQTSHMAALCRELKVPPS